MPTEEELTQGMVDVGDNLFLDDQGNWQTVQGSIEGDENQWMWTEDGIQFLGGATPNAINTPFLDINEQFRGGNPITAGTWQEAVSQSLEGFIRSDYGVDPIFEWQPGQSGLQDGSQFRIGTLQDLVSDDTIPGMFFDTSGPLARNMFTGDVVNPEASHWDPLRQAPFDPLMGLNPDQKLLAFEDIPLEQIEKMFPNAPGNIHTPSPEIQRIGRQIREQTNIHEAAKARGDGATAAAAGERLRQLHSQIAIERQRNPIFTPLAEAQQSGQLQDYNDLIWMLNMEQFATPPEIIKASPESVLSKFFDTPAYRLAFGNEDEVLDPTASPADRFRADPGYQFVLDEGMRNIERNASAKGLLRSGSTLRDLQQFGQGVADQNYQRWLGNNQSLFSDWQNRLQGMSSQGLGAAGQLAGASNQTGSTLAGLNAQLGNNISNLFNNQGALGGNTLLGTGAAHATTTQNAAALIAQIISANAQAANQASAQNASMALQSQMGNAQLQASGGGGISGALGGLGSAISSLGGMF